LLKLLDTITSSLDSNHYVARIIIDLEKAFDTVNFDILLLKLANYGFRGHINSYIRSYLTTRFQFVQCQSSSSSLLPIKCGVPQGSVLGPILFLLYINDLPNAFSHNSPLLFADDTTLTFISDSLSTLNSNINADLTSLHNWLTANKLTLNITKTNCINFSSPQCLPSPLAVFINNQRVANVSETTILGVIFDQHLTFRSHLSKLKGQLASALFIFSKIRHLIPLSIAWSLYYSLFYSHLSYCLLVWGNTHSSYLNPLNVLHNKFIRTLLYLPKRTPTSSIYLQTSLLPIESLYKYFVAIFIFKFLNFPHLLPPALLSLFLTSSRMHIYVTRAIYSHSLFHIHSSSQLRHRQISVSGPQIWVSIPLLIKDQPTITLFKRELRTFLLSVMT